MRATVVTQQSKGHALCIGGQTARPVIVVLGDDFCYRLQLAKNCFRTRNLDALDLEQKPCCCALPSRGPQACSCCTDLVSKCPAHHFATKGGLANACARCSVSLSLTPVRTGRSKRCVTCKRVVATDDQARSNCSSEVMTTLAIPFHTALLSPYPALETNGKLMKYDEAPKIRRHCH